MDRSFASKVGAAWIKPLFGQTKDFENCLCCCLIGRCVQPFGDMVLPLDKKIDKHDGLHVIKTEHLLYTTQNQKVLRTLGIDDNVHFVMSQFRAGDIKHCR